MTDDCDYNALFKLLYFGVTEGYCSTFSRCCNVFKNEKLAPSAANESYWRSNSSALPMYLLAVLSYACGQLGIYNHPLLEHSTFIIAGFIPTLSPISSLYFVRHYRDRLRWVFLRRSSILKESNSREFSTLRDSQSYTRTRTMSLGK
ncbi:hypothetical protein OSTOST_08993 [Ostertagia ostertagi]